MTRQRSTRANWGSSTNMWRDPRTVKPNGGCAVVVLALVAAPVVVGVTSLFV